MWFKTTPTGGLLRGEQWCIALSLTEVRALQAQAQKLQQLLTESQNYLMAEETLDITCETEQLSLYVTGLPAEFALTVRLQYPRLFEGEWAEGQAVLAELVGIYLPLPGQ